jgi:transcriptional regulator with XRE-family HTH domain
MKELGVEQKDLAAAAEVTDSYISQLLARKKSPPSPGRTGIYEKIGGFLRLPPSDLAKLAELQRKDELRKRVVDPPRPLLPACREAIVRKCDAARRKEVCRIFDKEPFGELERLVTQKLLEATQQVARQESGAKEWLSRLAQLTGRSYRQISAAMQQFLAIDALQVSDGAFVVFLDPMIESWDVDLKTFGMVVTLNRKLAPDPVRRFEFAEREDIPVAPGFQRFLDDKALSGDATVEEIDFLRSLNFKARQPSPIYYYRELQSLRDPLHFPNAPRDTGSENESRKRIVKNAKRSHS